MHESSGADDSAALHEHDEAEAAFRRYVLPEVEVLYRVACSITRDHFDAEDLVQDTLFRAHRAIMRFDGRHPRAWLLTILRNTHLNRLRRREPEPVRSPDAVQTLETSAPGPSPEDVVVGEMFDAAVEKAYRGLPERFRSVVELVDLDGLSYEEAAEILGIPIGTVMSRLHRARRRMRRDLGRAGIVPRRSR